MGISSGTGPQGDSSSTVSRSNWNLEMLVFEERGNWNTRRKTSRSKDENQQQTQPTSESRSRTWATLVEGECSAPSLRHPCSPSPSIHIIISYAEVMSLRLSNGSNATTETKGVLVGGEFIVRRSPI